MQYHSVGIRESLSLTHTHNPTVCNKTNAPYQLYAKWNKRQIYNLTEMGNWKKSNKFIDTDKQGGRGSKVQLSQGCNWKVVDTVYLKVAKRVDLKSSSSQEENL